MPRKYTKQLMKEKFPSENIEKVRNAITKSGKSVVDFAKANNIAAGSLYRLLNGAIEYETKTTKKIMALVDEILTT